MFDTTRFSDSARTFETPDERLGHLRSLFADTTPLLQAAIASTEPEGVVQTRLYERASARRWSKGRVTLLGRRRALHVSLARFGYQHRVWRRSRAGGLLGGR